LDKSGEFELQITGDQIRIYQVEESGSEVEMPFDSKPGRSAVVIIKGLFLIALPI